MHDQIMHGGNIVLVQEAEIGDPAIFASIYLPLLCSNIYNMQYNNYWGVEFNFVEFAVSSLLRSKVKNVI